MTADVAETALRLLDRALGAMNEAIEITTNKGPGAGIEFIADYLNNTDGIDEEIADRTPGDWLDKWEVSPADYVITGSQNTIGVADTECSDSAPDFIQRLTTEVGSTLLDHPEVIDVRLAVSLQIDPNPHTDDDDLDGVA